MRFYESIAENYENIFSPNEKQINFLKERASNKILDVACATGKVASEIKKAGFEVLGIDLEEKFIDKAINKNKISAKVMNMLDLDKLSENFGLIYCIGTSLVHLKTKEQIKSFLIKCYEKLEDKGYLVIQIINFYPFLNKNENFLGSLPTIKNDKVEFIRKYYRNGEYIRFNTIMNDGENSIENNIDLLPITAPEIKDILENIGFKNIEIYGGFNKSDFELENSIPLVISATK